MTRLMLLTALVVAGCQPSSAEIQCGHAVCDSTQRCAGALCVRDEPPQLRIEEPRPGALVAGDTLTVSGSVHDDNGLPTLELSLDEGKSWVVVPVSSEHFSARVALPSLDGRPVGLSLRAHDSRQQTATARVEIMLDNQPPVLTLGSPMEAAQLNATWFAAEPQVSGTVTDGSAVAALTVDVGEGDVAVTPTGNQFSFDWATPMLEDGIGHTVRVTAVDRAGNRTVVTRMVTVDVVPPEISFTVPGVDAVLGSAFFLGGGQVQGTVAGATKVTAHLGNGPQAANVVSGQWSVAFSPSPELDFEPQSLEVTATDEAGNVTRAERMTTVDVVAPVLKFTAPAQGARFNKASFTSGDDVTVAWAVTDGDPRVAVRNGSSPVVSPTFKVATSPMDNPKTYEVTLTAQDTAGNTSEQRLFFEVDRVRPTVVARIPAAERRNAAATVSIDFSEDVSGGPGLWLWLSPVNGTWTTPRHFEMVGLPADTAFSVIPMPVVDAFGNPLVGLPWVKFHTAPMVPNSSATLMPNVAHFKAAADADGVLTLFTASASSPAGYRWVRVNPKTGIIEDNRPAWTPVLGGSNGEVAAYGESRVNADLSAQRVSGATTYLPSSGERLAWVRQGDDPATGEIGKLGIVPVAAFPAEGSGLADVGYLDVTLGQASYGRVGLPTHLGLGMGRPTSMGFAADYWEAIEVKNGALKHRTFGCYSLYANVPPTCELSPQQEWADVAIFAEGVSHAVSNGCSVYVYNANSGKRLVRVAPSHSGCVGRGCPAPTVVELQPTSELRVASDRRDSNSFVGARRLIGGEIQLTRLPLDPDCQGAFADIPGAKVAVPANAEFEPVSFGGKAALLYVDTGNVLKVYVP